MGEEIGETESRMLQIFIFLWAVTFVSPVILDTIKYHERGSVA